MVILLQKVFKTNRKEKCPFAATFVHPAVDRTIITSFIYKCLLKLLKLCRDLKKTKREREKLSTLDEVDFVPGFVFLVLGSLR